jgi:hydroxyacylglutathione hydrolase
MHVQSIPMWVGSGNNYAYLVVDEKSKDAVIVDPANPPEVSPVLKEAIEAGRINLRAIVNTHHHRDHAGGNSKLRQDLGVPDLEIIGGKDCAGVTRTPAHGESFPLGDAIKMTAVHTPCHTQDSVCWYLEDTTTGQRAVFTGDTLFVAGCGRFFEGTAEEMHEALNVRLGALPDDTKVYCGHEYTKSNVKFAKSVSKNEAIAKLEAFTTANQETTGVFTIGDEKKHNVFMMVQVGKSSYSQEAWRWLIWLTCVGWQDPELQQVTGETEPVKVMAKLRSMKDSF